MKVASHVFNQAPFLNGHFHTEHPIHTQLDARVDVEVLVWVGRQGKPAARFITAIPLQFDPFDPLRLRLLV